MGGFLRRLVREPLVHFIVVGAVLFAGLQAWRARTDTYRIEVTPAHVAELSQRYVLQYGERPTPAVLEQLVRDDIKDEMLVREGRVMGLDKGDEIIRRRMVQKAQFLIQSSQLPAEPTERQLGAYYAAHADRYTLPAEATFTHIFFADDRGDGRARAAAVLARLPAGMTRAPDRGDPFPDLYDFEHYGPNQVARLFGHTPFADAVQTAPVGRWAGPFRSAYGWHLLYVSARAAALREPLDKVHDRVAEDWRHDALDAANAAAFDRLARRFTVVRRDRPAAP